MGYVCQELNWSLIEIILTANAESEARLRIRAAILFVFALLYPGNMLLL